MVLTNQQMIHIQVLTQDIQEVPQFQQLFALLTFDGSYFINHKNPVEQLEEVEGRRLLPI